MPKAVKKTKHGNRAAAPDHGQSDSLSDTHLSSREAFIARSTDNCHLRPHHHHKPYKQGVTPSKAEKRRDKVLTKLCDRASAHLVMAGPQVAVGDGALTQGGDHRPPTSDQVSLQDCLIDISTTELWGSGFLAPDASSDPAVSQDPPVLAPDNNAPCGAVSCQLIPGQLQQHIEAAVQKLLAAGFRPEDQKGSGFYSQVFLMPKLLGGAGAG